MWLKGIVIALLVILVSAFGVDRYYNQERNDLTDAVRQAAGGSYAPLPDGTVHYQVAGPDTGRVVVLVHGFSVPYYIWDPLFDDLASAGFRVVRYDIYGRGFSDRPRASYDADLFDRQLVDLLAALKIDRPIDLGGLSMGGAVVETFARRHPDKVRSLLLFDPTMSSGGAQPWMMHVPLLRNWMMTVMVAPTMAAGQLDDFRHPDRFPDWPERYRVQMRYKGFLRAILSTRLASEHQNVRAEYEEVGQLNLPVLLVWGKEDHTVPFALSAELRKAIPQAEFHPIDDAGHVPYMEHPEVVDPVVVQFLKRPSR
jgi:pimeloyl-ACP methyl ester carboxylesterase